jgi:hypothetical protein
MRWQKPGLPCRPPLPRPCRCGKTNSNIDLDR